MNRLNFFKVFVFAALFCVCITLASQEERLVAPEPPEAIEVSDFPPRSITGGGSEMFTRVFFTPLPVEDVTAFYRNNVGDMQPVIQGKEYRADLIDLEFKEVAVLKVYSLPRKPGVTVKCVRTLKRDYCSSDYFNKFRDMASNLDQYSRKDYTDLCEQYGYLEIGYYGYCDERENMTKDESLYREYFKELEPEMGKAMTAEEMSKQAQQLIQEGRMDEARELLEKAAKLQQDAYMHAMGDDPTQMMHQGQKDIKDNWEEWLEFLKELDGMIMPTVVFIDTHPSEWTQDEWIHKSIEW